MNTQQTFSPSKPRRAYTTEQWKEKEDWYTKEIEKVSIGPSPSPQDVQVIASQVDSLLSIARIDYAYVSQAYERYNTMMKIEEKRLFVDLKLQPPQQYANMKLTIDEMKGVVASVLLNNKWQNTGLSLYSLVQEASTRNIFMKAIIDILNDKKDMLITHSGMLKIENSLNSMSASVPSN